MKWHATWIILMLGTVQLGADAALGGDETIIRDSIASYVAAFNRGDAAAVANHWSEQGEWVSPDGERIKGREKIQAEMQDYFDEGGAPRIEISETKIRFLVDAVALEEGQARVFRQGEAPSDTTYIAIHVRQPDGWKLDSVRETVAPSLPTNYPHLKDLEWMVGAWVDQGEQRSVETNCQWTKNRNFLMRSFAVKIKERIDLEGTQIIGWDAKAQQIRSWIFDSAGGFGEGTWVRDNNRWIIKQSQTLQDGTMASSINIITKVDDNSCTWESTAREMAGELQPSIDPVVVVRKQ